ncbi:MAG: hypothetical protein FXF47_05925 [Candidatus Mcinerneyibacterium aminivorans]|uniref:ECF transporter S component n=1 Tax=Candidatus Mcinerneyibacterium aminivorans TaxID=2703815 RepID=A0A5D0MFA0_9BACT|nr:MAG: hypothetical protein FXF47_05925 [Candidatus Mcinerneyibacterium aminivorans]
MKKLTVSNSLNIAAEIGGVLSISILLPFIFHVFGISGSVFLPIYTAVLLGTFLFNNSRMFLAAFFAPILNNLITGMPAAKSFPMMQILLVELVVLVFVSKIVKKLNTKLSFQIILSVVFARLASIAAVLIYSKVKLTWWVNHLYIGIPGVILNILIVYLVLKGKREIERR